MSVIFPLWIKIGASYGPAQTSSDWIDEYQWTDWHISKEAILDEGWIQKVLTFLADSLFSPRHCTKLMRIKSAWQSAWLDKFDLFIYWRPNQSHGATRPTFHWDGPPEGTCFYPSAYQTCSSSLSLLSSYIATDVLQFQNILRQLKKGSLVWYRHLKAV